MKIFKWSGGGFLFKAEFGDIIISPIHDDEEKRIYQERLGKKINLDNIDHHLSSLRVVR